MASTEDTDASREPVSTGKPASTNKTADAKAPDLGDVVNWGEFEEEFGGSSADKFDAAALAALLKKKVIGQDKVADQVTSQLKRRLAQVKLSKRTKAKVEKPLGVFLLAGPPGVGKTYFCKVLAENMYDGKGRLLTIDMTQMDQAHNKASLIGSPQGYVGGGGMLTNALQQNPKYIVLLDEFEKAHADVQKAFLTAWNDGFITDARSQRQVSTTQALFMLTTNAAMERLVEIEQSFKDDPDTRDRSILEALKQAGYAAEVLSRIDYVFVFDQLDNSGMARVAALEIQLLAKKYALTVAKIDTDYLIFLISKAGAFESGGARQLARVLERQLGDQMMDAQADGAEFVRISLVEEKPFVRAIKVNNE